MPKKRHFANAGLRLQGYVQQRKPHDFRYAAYRLEPARFFPQNSIGGKFGWNKEIFLKGRFQK